ncbi:MAG TPA: chloride channel protein [Edaphocola sp.]|nr:chloride channel protein [Edaphocola sp.]
MYESLLRNIVHFNHWRKKHLSQNVFFMLVAGVVGAIGGLAASLLKKLTHLVASFLANDLQWEFKYYLYFFLPLIGIFLTVLYIRVFIRRKVFRQGIPPLIESIAHKRSRLDFHNIYSQIITSALTVGFGGSAGLESPSVYSGGAVGSNIARLFRFTYKERTLLLACGAAAGISGAFDSPVAGLLFATEVILPSFTIPVFTPLLIASAMASIVSHMVYDKPLFAYVADTWVQEGVIIYIIFGVISGFYSVYYGYVFERMQLFFSKIKNRYNKVWIGGLSLGILIMVFPALYGEGYIHIQKLLNEDYSSLLSNSLFSNYQNMSWVLIVFAILSLVAKTFACGITLSCGGNGGMFGPSVVIGGLLGFIFAYSMNQAGLAHLDVTHFIVVGMAASVSGVMHAPLTGVFLSAEITGSYVLMIPLMIVSALAFFINKSIRKYSIYTRTLANNGNLLETENHDLNALNQIKLISVLEYNYIVLDPEKSAISQKEMIIHSEKSLFPVVNKNGVLIGVLSFEHLLECFFSSDASEQEELVGSLVSKSDQKVYLDFSLYEVLQIMDKLNLNAIPVVNEKEQYIGFVSKDVAFNKYRSLLKSKI